MKYFILHRTTGGISTSLSDKWTLLQIVDSLDGINLEWKKEIDFGVRQNHEYRVIKGEELPWEEEYEEITYTQKRLKSKKLKVT